jgi:hypothetical protein
LRALDEFSHLGVDFISLGRSWNEIASELGIGKGTAQRAVQTIQHGR